MKRSSKVAAPLGVRAGLGSAIERVNDDFAIVQGWITPADVPGLANLDVVTAITPVHGDRGDNAGFAPRPTSRLPGASTTGRPSLRNGEPRPPETAGDSSAACATALQGGAGWTRVERMRSSFVGAIKHMPIRYRLRG
jgi:hypothetical protein